jgi:transcriptional regulator with XRE-family HTH domain
MLVDKSAIADRIRDARLSHGLSQVELAQKLGVTQGTISRAERGNGDIRLGTLMELTRALDLDLVVIKRSQRALLDRLTADFRTGPTAIYTGMGEEPYVDDGVNQSSGLEPHLVDAIDDAAMASPASKRRRRSAAASTTSAATTMDD